MRKAKTILIINRCELFPVCQGNRARILALMRALRYFGFSIVLIAKARKGIYSNKAQLKRIVNELILVDDESKFPNVLQDAVYQFHPMAVISEYLHLAYCLDAVDHRVLKIIDTHDIMHILAQRYLAGGLSPYLNITRDEEKDLLGRADVLIAIQKNEMKILSDMLPQKKVVCVMHYPGFEFKKARDQYQRNRILFVGSDNNANQYGMQQFLTNAWPIIRNADPTVELHIYGVIGDTMPARMDGIKKMGYVDDITSAYRQAKVVINPTLIGTGLKIKTVEALCYGKALVSTHLGVDGIEDGAQKAFILAENMTHFAKEIIRLLNNDSLRHRLEDNALAFAKKKFNREAVYKDLLDILDHYKFN